MREYGFILPKYAGQERSQRRQMLCSSNSWNMKVMFDDDCHYIGITVQIMHRNELVTHMSVCLYMWMEEIFWDGGLCSIARSVKGSF